MTIRIEHQVRSHHVYLQGDQVSGLADEDGMLCVFFGGTQYNLDNWPKAWRVSVLVDEAWESHEASTETLWHLLTEAT